MTRRQFPMLSAADEHALQACLKARNVRIPAHLTDPVLRLNFCIENAIKPWSRETNRKLNALKQKVPLAVRQVEIIANMADDISGVTFKQSIGRGDTISAGYMAYTRLERFIASHGKDAVKKRADVLGAEVDRKRAVLSAENKKIGVDTLAKHLDEINALWGSLDVAMRRTPAKTLEALHVLARAAVDRGRDTQECEVAALIKSLANFAIVPKAPTLAKAA